MRYFELFESTGPAEDWTTYVVLFGRNTNIGWRLDKDASNRSKHGYPLKAGIAVLASRSSVFTVDHVNGEEREVYVGPSESGKLLVTVISWVSEEDGPAALRIISVREADSKDRRMTEETHPTDKLDADDYIIVGNEQWRPAREGILAGHARADKRRADREAAARAEQKRPAAE